MDFIWLEGKQDGFDKVMTVRQAVFVEEQGYSYEGEFDSIDETCLHLLGCKEGKPVCTARLFLQEQGSYHIGRVAVLRQLRGTGIGHQMLKQLEEKAILLGGAQIILSAQADKTAFYEKAGFLPTGVVSKDEGQPHVEMSKEL